MLLRTVGTHTHAHTRVHTRTHTRVRTHARAHTCTHTCTHMHAHTHACTNPDQQQLQRAGPAPGAQPCVFRWWELKMLPHLLLPPLRGGGREGPWGVWGGRGAHGGQVLASTRFYCNRAMPQSPVSALPDGNLRTFTCSNWPPHHIEAGGLILSTYRTRAEVQPPDPPVPCTCRKMRPMQLSTCGSCSGWNWTTARYASTAST